MGGIVHDSLSHHNYLWQIPIRGTSNNTKAHKAMRFMGITYFQLYIRDAATWPLILYYVIHTKIIENLSP